MKDDERCKRGTLFSSRASIPSWRTAKEDGTRAYLSNVVIDCGLLFSRGNVTQRHPHHNSSLCPHSAVRSVRNGKGTIAYYVATGAYLSPGDAT